MLYNKYEIFKVIQEEAVKYNSDATAALLEALKEDLQDGGNRYEDIIIATFGHY